MIFFFEIFQKLLCTDASVTIKKKHGKSQTMGQFLEIIQLQQIELHRSFFSFLTADIL